MPNLAQQHTSDVTTGDGSGDRAWVVLLVGGILTVLFGAFVLTFRHASLYALTYFYGAWAILVGVVHLIDAATTKQSRWPSELVGTLAIGAGIAAIGWPHITLYVVATLLGWLLLVRGLIEIVAAFLNFGTEETWWVGLLKGLVLLILAVWALRHPGHTLTVLIVVLGISSILSGIFEIADAALLRGAARRERISSQARTA